MRSLDSQAAEDQQMQGLNQGERIDVQGPRTPGLRLDFSAVV